MKVGVAGFGRGALVPAMGCAWALAVGCILPLMAQDFFSTPIPESGISVELEDVATVPDSSPGLPPRLSVLTQDPAGRLFVCDQRGPLYAIDPGSGSATEYLDMRDFAQLGILATSEAGFQSFCFHPDFMQTGEAGFGRLYTIHSSSATAPAPDFDPGGATAFHTILLEWRTGTPTSNVFVAATPGTPYREILRFKQPYGNHNAGLIAFNPTVVRGDGDYGCLYVALGDGGSGGDPQENGEDPSNPYGALLRIDPLGTDGRNGQYGIVTNNVLAADGDGTTLPEIYCYGLRNPQRFGWDTVTTHCFIADIGQNAVEEIDLATNGANYGWDKREGSFAFEGGDTTGLVDPVTEYDHANVVTNPPTAIGNRAVTVGEVARGTCIPPLEGKLMIADFPTGLIFLLDVDNDPLDGGQGGLAELALAGESGGTVRFLEVINAARAKRGLPPVTRADLRFGVNTPGRIFLINKHDGIVRRIAPQALPAVSIGATNGQVEVRYTGVLQSAPDLQSRMQDEVPQPASPWRFVPTESVRFFRSVRR